jgi:hypothetical protein
MKDGQARGNLHARTCLLVTRVLEGTPLPSSFHIIMPETCINKPSYHYACISPYFLSILPFKLGLTILFIPIHGVLIGLSPV